MKYCCGLIRQVSLVGLPALLVLLQHLELFTKIPLLISSLYVQPTVQPVTSLAHVNTAQLSSNSVSLSQNTMTTNGMMITTHTHTHIRLMASPLSGTTRVSWYQKGKTNLDFTGTRDSEWQWHQLDHMQIYTSLQTDNHASTPPLNFLQAGYPSCCPTNSIKALKV